MQQRQQDQDGILSRQKQQPCFLLFHAAKAARPAWLTGQAKTATILLAFPCSKGSTAACDL
eukprot:1161082-Pelagomonas_calceolata.AAC.1